MKPVATDTAPAPPVLIPETAPAPDRRSAVMLMAPLGLLLAGMAVAVWIQWITSGG